MSLPTPRPTQPSFKWAPGFFSGGERPERETDHSPTSSADVKNKWNYIYIPPIHLYVVEWGTLLLPFFVGAWGGVVVKALRY